jgi:4-hydroxy-tetrahydrodipicolinate synthase
MTPFTAQDELDEDGLCNSIDFALDNGGDGVVVIGRIGEFYGLTMDERKRAIDVAKAHVAGRAPVGFGVMDATYDVGIELARHGARVGMDFVLSRGAVDRNPVEYFKALSAELPTLAYDYAEERELPIEEVVPIMEACDNLVAFKVSGTSDKIAAMKEHTDMPILCGWDTQSLLAYTFGAVGVVSGSAAVFPTHEVEIYRLCMEKKWDEATDLFHKHILPIMNLSTADPHGPSACKSILMWQGIIENPRVRAPFQPMGENRTEELRRTLRWCGMLPDGAPLTLET